MLSEGVVATAHRLAHLRDAVEEAHGRTGRAHRAAPPTGRSPRRRRPLYAVVFAIALLAYLALWLAGRSPWGRYLEHDIVVGGTRSLLTSVLFVTGWTLMVTAMMLPTALPLFDAFNRIVRGRRGRRRLIVVLAAGFLGVWAAFGSLLLSVDGAVHVVVDRVRFVAEWPQVMTAAVLVAAGLYQFSELKRRCLTRCRSPRSLIVPRWSGRSAAADAFHIGVDYGISCLGCCWLLMALLFAIGSRNLGVMLAFGLLMALEKNVPRVRRLTPVLGAVLVAVGFAVAVVPFA